MGRKLLIAWIFVVTAGALAFAQDTSTPTGQSSTPVQTHTPTQLPRAKAEPDNGQSYGKPIIDANEGPSEADVGPVQKHFVRASTTDNLADSQVDDNASQVSHEKMSLDKRISVPLIHDVQNDGPNQAKGAGGNHVLSYEVKYLDWGAVTQEQLQARRGHYFTITWDNHGPEGDFVARFQYRQVLSKEIIRTLEQPMPRVSGSARSYFAVVDKAYLAYGPVVSWRFTVLKGDTVVAEAKSFIW